QRGTLQHVEHRLAAVQLEVEGGLADGFRANPEIQDAAHDGEEQTTDRGAGHTKIRLKRGWSPRRRQVCRKRRQRAKTLMLDVCVGWKTAKRFPPQVSTSYRLEPRAKDHARPHRVDSCASMAALSMTERTSKIFPSLNA